MTFGSVFGRTFSPTFQPHSQAAVSGGDTATVVANGDTYLVSANNSNYGRYDFVVLNTSTVRTGLCRFILSSIPSSATCLSAKMTVSFNHGISAPAVISIYEIASANGDWVEGNAKGYAETGSACWNYKAYHASTPTSWAGSAGMSTAGTDYVDTIIGSYTLSTGTVSANTPIDIIFNASGLAVVKSWFGESTNSGIVIWANKQLVLNSSEVSTESYRPTLTITYS